MTRPADQARRFRRPWLIRLGLLVVGLYAVIAIAFIVMQRSLVYPTLKTGPLTAVKHPAEGAVVADVTATTDDGLALHGWHVRPKGNDGGDRPVVLIFHGNGGHRAQSLKGAELFCSFGAEVLAFDYRGYGENAGSPSEAGLTEDARAVWRFATDSLGIAPDRIVAYGESLGGGVAVRLAADLSESGEPPAGLIVCNTFTSLADIASHRFPWLPVRLALLDRYESERRIADVTCPILVLSGDRDASIPPTFLRRLFEAAPIRSASGIEKRLVILPGAGHIDMLATAPDAYGRAIDEFLRTVVNPARGPESRSPRLELGTSRP